MATISGQLIFSIKRNNQIDSNSYGIGNVPIVLQNTTTNEMLGVFTESDGTYTFTQVPNGSYRIVLVYEYEGKTLNSPAAFTSTNTEVGDVPTAKLPPYTILNGDYPTQTTNLSAITPTTVFVTIENDEDATAQTIFLGPTRYEEIKFLLDSSAIISDINLLKNIDNGTFGEEPPGTQPNGGPAINPYPDITTEFTFIQQKFPIRDGYYSIGNTISPYPEFLWWRLSDRTTGIETGRMQIVNGAFTGEPFLTIRESVEPFTNYVFSAWLVNLDNSTSQQAPKFGVKITGESSTDVLYNEDLGDYFNPPQDILPIWKEVGTAFNSANNTSVGLTFYSLGEAASGDDYAVDDVRLSLIIYPVVIPTKTVNTTYATLNQIITYTITVDNTNDNPLTNVSIKDTLSDNLEFVQGSVTINNETDSTANPNDGFVIPDVEGQTTTTVTFQAKVISLPSSTTIDNVAILDYDYTPIIGGIPNSFSQDSESASIYVGKAVIEGENSGFIKSVNEKYAKVGDILTYTIVAENVGNVDATNIVIVDNIPQGTTYVQNSISADVSFLGSPLTTINLTNPLSPNDKATITYQVKVDEIPQTNPIPNSAQITYNYTGNPEEINGATGKGTTNTVNTLVVNPTISIVKSQNLSVAIVGDIVTYTLDVQNTGNIEYTDVIVTDKLPLELTFVEGSLTINNNPSDENISSGANVGTLGAGETATLVFKAKVNSANIIENNATVNYTVTTSSSSTNYNKTSNTVQIQSYNIPTLEVTKTSSDENIYVGDIFTYTINVKNTGDLTVSDIIISDVLPYQFEITKIEINNENTNTTILDNLNIGSLAPNESKNIVVTILVLSNNLSNFQNTVSLNGTSQVNEENSPTKITASAKSNQSVTTIKPNPTISIVKSQDITKALVGNMVTYTFDIENTGNINYTNVIVTDDLSSYLSFVEGSLIVNNNSSSENISDGVLLGTLEIGQKATIIFKAKVNSVPPTNIIENNGKVNYTVMTSSSSTNYKETSNTVQLQVYNIPTLEITKTSSAENVYIGNTFTYTINVKNTGDISISNVIISDFLPSQFVITNITIDNKNANTTVLDNLNIGSIGANESKNIVVTILVVSNTLSNFQNSVSVNGTAQVNEENNPTKISASAMSNSVTTITPSPSISIIKSEDITEALVGNVVTYTLDIENTGNINLTNVVITDNLQEELTFVEGSLNINNISSNENISAGISLGTLAINQKANITFKAKINNVPQSNIISNNAKAEYTVITESTTTNYSETSNTVQLQVFTPNLEVTKTSSAQNIYVGNKFTYTINVKNTGEVNISNIIISDELPSQFEITKIEINNENANSTELNNLNIGSIGANESKNIVVTILVLSNTLSNFINNISLSGTAQVNEENLPTKVTASAMSNSITTVEPNPSISIVKSENITESIVGNIVTYTLNIENTGNINLTNVVVTDTLKQQLTFVEGSLTINNTSSDENISDGISLGTLEINEKVNITFKAEVNAQPPSNIIDNNAKVDYTVMTDSSSTNYNKTSNTVQLQVYVPTLEVTKTSSKENVYVGDTFTYTINVKNTGAINISNIIISDELPSQFLITSITIDNKNANTTYLDNLNIGNLSPNESKNIIATILVVSNTLSNFINNISVNGTAQVNEENEPTNVTSSAMSNSVTTITPSPSISIIKSQNITEAIVGNVVTYTLDIENTGNINLTNVVITDNLQDELTFVEGSLTINNTSSDENISGGISLGTLEKNEKANITFKVEVNNKPQSSIIENTAKAEYTVMTSSSSTNYNETSNTVQLQVFTPSLEVTKTSSKENVYVGEEFTYTINVKNTGEIDISNTTISDVLPSQFEIIKIEIDNTNDNIAYLDNLNIGILTPNESKNIVVTILVLSNSLLNFQNTVSINGTAQVNEVNQPTKVTSSAISNSVSTVESNPSISIVKSQNITKAIVGDTVTYTLDIENTGNINATNVVITDNLQVALTFVEGSLTINNTPSNENISSGISLGTLEKNEKVNITFKAKVNNMPPSNIIENNANVEYTIVINSSSTNYNETSNTTQLQVFTPSLEVTKTSSSDNVYVGEEFTYTINVKNTGEINISNIIISDELPSQFQITKIEINNTNVNTTNLDNLNIGTLAPNESKNIVVTILVLSNTLSNFQNEVFVNGTAQANEVNQATKVTSSAVSNSVSTITPAPSISITKSQNVNTVFVGEKVTYTLVVKNTGNINLSNLIISDNLSPQLAFVADSITINGAQTTGNIISELNIGDLNTNEETIIKFQVIVNSIHPSETIANYARVTYNVDLANKETYSKQSNVVELFVESPEISITKQSNKQNVFVGETFTYTIILKNLSNIPITNVILNDELPRQLTVTNININNEDSYTTQLDGLNVGNLDANETITVVVTIKVTSNNLTNFKNTVIATGTVQSSPSNPPKTVGGIATDSQYINTISPITTLNVEKSQSSDIAVPCETITYTLNITNTGNIAYYNLLVIDKLSPKLTFIQNSLIINKKQSSSNINLGVKIDTLNVGETVVITFKVRVNNICDNLKISNSATVLYSVILPNEKINLSSVSNKIYLQPQKIPLKVCQKTNKDCVSIGKKLKYEVVIKNSSNLTFGSKDNPVILHLNLPPNTVYVPRSLTINLNQIKTDDLPKEIDLGTLSPYSFTVVTFKVYVSSYKCNPIKNSSYISYITLDSNGNIIMNKIESNTTCTFIK